jgi:hypothetical protein
LVVASLALAGAGSFSPVAIAASKHNGGCQGFAGSSGGQNYAGIKCYVDPDRGSWIIRHVVKERDNPDEYRQLLRVPRRPFRCTLIKGAPLPGNGVININYEIERCG